MLPVVRLADDVTVPRDLLRVVDPPVGADHRVAVVTESLRYPVDIGLPHSLGDDGVRDILVVVGTPVERTRTTAPETGQPAGAGPEAATEDSVAPAGVAAPSTSAPTVEPARPTRTAPLPPLSTSRRVGTRSHPPSRAPRHATVANAGEPGTRAFVRRVKQFSAMKAWRVHEFGEPSESLRARRGAGADAGPGEVLVRVAATTLNFNDVDGVRGRYRTVRHPSPTPPAWRCWAWWRAPVPVPSNGSASGWSPYRTAHSAAMRAGRRPERHGVRNAAGVRVGRHAGGGRVLPVPPVVARPARTGAAAGGRDRSHSRRRRRGRLRGDPTRQRGRRPGHRHGRLGRQARAVPVAGRLGRHQLPGRRFRRGGARGNRRPWASTWRSTRSAER